MKVCKLTAKTDNRETGKTRIIFFSWPRKSRSQQTTKKRHEDFHCDVRFAFNYIYIENFVIML